MGFPRVSAAQQVGGLLKMVWRLAADRRRAQVTYLSLLFIAQSIALCQPLLIGEMLNAVQEGGPRLWSRLWPFFFGLLALEIGFWSFHGPARVLERQLAFHIRVKFRERMTRPGCQLPIRWNRAH